MKKSILYFILSFNIFSYGQNHEMPKIEFTNEFKVTNRYIDLLGIKDTNAILIKIGRQNSHFYEQDVETRIENHYIVYLNDGKIKKYKQLLLYKNRKKENDSISEIKMKKEDFQFYWEFLDTCIKKGKFDIDINQLNIREKEIGGGIATRIFTGGTTYRFEIIQGNRFISLTSHSAKEYIADKISGYTERQKLVELVEEVEKIVKIY